jgi:hypothetical protein
MRMRRTLALAAAAAMLAGCGDRNLVLKVDVLSFVSPASRQQDFGPIPAVPGGFATGEIPVVDDQRVSLLQGLSDATNIKSVTVSFGALAIDYAGAGEATVRIYMSDELTDPRTTAPVLTQAVTLTPGQTDTLSAVLGDDPRVLALFKAKQLRLSVTTAVLGPSSGPDLSGRIQFTAIDGVVIAGSKGF